VRFHQFERDTGRRIRYHRVASELTQPVGPSPEPWFEHEDGQPHIEREARPDAVSPEPPARPSRTEADPGAGAEVPFRRIVKGFELEPDRYVMVTPEELRALEPERTQTIEIEGFVDLSEIDPVHFEKSYYVAPRRGVGAEKPYALLLAALQHAGRVGVARFVMRTREYLAAIRPMDGVLGLETLFHADEIRSVQEIGDVPVSTDVAQRELAMALQFIELLQMPWQPDRYRDTYRDRVLELLRTRAESEGIQSAQEPAGPAAASAVPDLMAALKASVEGAKERREPDPATERPARRTGKPRRRTG
jgi:DNA end-binding protein Ku